MKKLLALILALAMVFSLAVAASANEGTGRPTQGTADTVQGTITINNITIEDGNPTATYEIYQILKLNSFDFTSGSYFYEYATKAWEDFFTTGAGKDYIGLNEKGLLEWKGTTDAARVEQFAKLALEYAKTNDIEPTKTTDTPDGEEDQYTVDTNKIIFSELELGYYLVDSTVGALCGLSTTNPDGLINSKNGIPTLDKQVQEDLSGQWGDSNSADIGQDVNFRITVHVHDGAQDYILHDTMEKGFTFNKDVKVEVLGSTGVYTEYTGADNFEVKIDEKDTQSFQIIFTKAFCDILNTNDRLIIHYSAMLNRNAEIGNSTTDNPSNENTAYLSFGEGHKTAPDATTTMTYGFDLVKTDGQNKLLDGSEFRIYSHETAYFVDDKGEPIKDTEGNLIKDAKDIPQGVKAVSTEVTIVPLLDNNDDPVYTADNYNMYRKARPDETGYTAIVVNGKVRIIGLDNGVYYLEETKAPNGFNAITSRQKFTIADNNLDAIIASGIVSTNSGVQVVNHTGTMLPETGGLGTLLFTVLGGSTVLGTGVVLVTKKRMSKIKDED